MFALGTMVFALLLSFLIPRRHGPHRYEPAEEPATELLDALATDEPVEPPVT